MQRIGSADTSAAADPQTHRQPARQLRRSLIFSVRRLRTSPLKPSKDYQWLRSIHRYWILPAEMVATVLLIAALLAAVFLSLLGARQLVASTFGGLLVASFAAAMIQHFLFYRLIRCPTCGHNPTRYKNGKNIPTATAWKHLRDMQSCPLCHGNANEPNVA